MIRMALLVSCEKTRDFGSDQKIFQNSFGKILNDNRSLH